MARGLPIKQTLIGHSLYGDHNGKRLKWFVSITDNIEALNYATDLGMTNVKTYPIYKDEKRH